MSNALTEFFSKSGREGNAEGVWTPRKLKEMLSWVGFHIFLEIGEQFSEGELEDLIEKWHFRKNYSYSPAKTRPILKQLRFEGLLTHAAQDMDEPRENEYMFSIVRF